MHTGAFHTGLKDVAMTAFDNAATDEATNTPANRTSLVRNTSLIKRELRAPLRTPQEILSHFQPDVARAPALKQAFEAHLLRSPELPKVPSRWKTWGLKALHLPLPAIFLASATLPLYFDWSLNSVSSAVIGMLASAVGIFCYDFSPPGPPHCPNCTVTGLNHVIQKAVSERNSVIAEREQIGATAMILALAQTDNTDLGAIAPVRLQGAKLLLKSDDPSEWTERLESAITASRENETKFNRQQAEKQQRQESAGRLAEARDAFKIPL